MDTDEDWLAERGSGELRDRTSLYLALNGHPLGQDYLWLRCHYDRLPVDGLGRHWLHWDTGLRIWILPPRLHLPMDLAVSPVTAEALADVIHSGFRGCEHRDLYAGAICYEDQWGQLIRTIGQLHGRFRNCSHRYRGSCSVTTGILEPATSDDFWEAVRALKQWHLCPC